VFAGWRSLTAAQAGRVNLADGNAFFNRSGPRVVHSAEIAAEMMWPELRGRWGHHGHSWLSVEVLPGWLSTMSSATGQL
jgi:iron complex transport system substrate-binding protein